MMHPEVLSAEAWKTVRSLAEGGWLDGWTLAGGTGLALHLGHRYSEDLDLFGDDPFQPLGLAESLSRLGQVRVQQAGADTLHLELNGLRVSFLRAERPLLFKGKDYRGLCVADPRDIAVMKVIDVGGRGSRKDFVDLYFFLNNGGTLAEVLHLTQERFETVDFNTYHLLKSLVYFEDAEQEPMPKMILPATWESIKEFLVNEVRRLS